MRNHFFSRMNRTAAALFLLGAFLWAAGARAQSAPGMINFQGRLTDTSNNPLSGNHSFIFSLHVAATGGLPIWTETQPAIPVTNGIFSAQLGAVTPLTSDLFAGATLYLQVAVDGVILSPRERLVASAYAFSAERLQGYAASYFVSTGPLTQQIAGDKTFTGKLSVSSLAFSGALTSDPAGAAGGLYFNSLTNKLRLHIGSGFVDIATGTIAGMTSVSVTAAQFSGDGAATPLLLQSSSVTLQGNQFNAANKLVQLDALGKLPAVDGSQLTGIGIVAGSVDTAKLAADAVTTEKILAGAVTDAKLAGSISQSKVSSLTADLGSRLLKTGDTMTGDLNVGSGASALAVSTAGHISLGNLPGAPPAARGRIWFDPNDLSGEGSLKISLNGTSYVPFSTGTAGGGISIVNVTPTEFTGNGAGSPLKLESSSVTLQGNTFNAANKLLLLDATGKLPALDGSQLTGVGIQAGSVDSTKLADGAVITAKLAAGAVDSAKLADSAVITAKLAAGAVDTAKLAADAVTSEKILAGAVGTAKLAADAVTSEKILAGAVGTAKLAADAVTSEKILAGAVTDAKLAGSISQSKVSSLTTDMGNRLLKAGDAMSGDLNLGSGASAVTVSTSGFIALGNLAAAPTAGAGRLYYDSALRKLRISTGTTASQWVDISTGEVSPGGSDPTKVAKAGDAMSGDLMVGGVTNVTVSTAGHLTFAGLGGAPVASRGRIWYDPNYNISGALMVSFDGVSYSPISTGSASGGISNVSANAQQFSGDGAGSALTLVSSSVTLQGNQFNAASRLVQMTSDNKLPAVDGSLLTGVLSTVGAGSVDSTKLADGAVVSAKLAAGAVDTAKLADGAVDSAKLADGAVLAQKIAAGAVDTAKLATDAVITAAILSGAVTSPKLADGAVTALKLAAGSVDSTKLADLGYVTFSGLAGAPGSAAGRLYYDSADRKLKLSTGAATADWVTISTGEATSGGGGANAMTTDTAQTVTGAKTFDANLVMGNGQLGAAAGKYEITVATPVRFVNMAADPAATSAGAVYYNTSSNLLRMNMNGNWVSISTGAAGGGSGFWGDATPNIYNTNAGNVGFGTASPGEKLDISGAVVLRGMGAPALSSGGQGKLFFDSSSNKLKLSENGSAFVNLIGGAGGAITLQPATPGASDSGHLNITGTGLFGGNVAVGTTTTSSKLHVLDGDIRISTTTGSRGIIFQDGSMQTSAAGTSLWTTAGVNIANTNAGGVGIGTTDPGGKLEVAGAGNVLFNMAGKMAVNSAVTASTLTVKGTIESTGGGFKFPDGSTQITAAGSSQWVTSGSDVLNANLGSIGVGTTAPAARLHVSSNGAAGTDSLFVVSTGTAAGSEIMVLKGDGRLGIGATSPAYPLHIVSNLPVRTTLMVDNNSTGVNTSVALRFAKNASDRWNIFTDVLQNGTNDLTFYDSVASQHRLYISDAGNLGVGTTAPSARLHVSGTGGVLLNAGDVGVGTTSPQAPFNVVGVSSMSASSAGPALLVSQSGAGPSAAFLGGRVGVGTTSPAERLDVDGALVMRGMAAPAVSAASQAKFYFDSTTKKLKLSEDGGSFISLIGAAGGAVSLQGSTPGTQDGGNLSLSGTGLFGGNVGIGTLAPGDKLDVAGNIRMSAGGTLQTSGVAPLHFDVDSAAAVSSITFTRGSSVNMVISSHGYVGLGAEGPSERLDVSGAMVLRGMAAPTLASAGQGKIYFDSGNSKIKISEGGGAFTNLIGGAGGAITLQANTPGIADSGHLNVTGSGIFGGNVGIGIVNPTQKFDLRSGGLAVSYDGTAGKSLFVSNANGRVGVGTTSPLAPLHVTGAGGVLLNAGNVGISTNSPQSTLDIQGTFSAGTGVDKATITAAADLYLAGNIIPRDDGQKNLGASSYRWSQLYVSQVNVASKIEMAGSPINTSGAITPQTDNLAGLGTAAKRWAGIHGMNLYTGGSVGIGTTLPTHRLDVTGGGAIIRSSLTVTGTDLSGTDMVFAVSGATLTARYDGKVGIGTSVPTSTLTVVGLIESQGGGFMFPDGTIQNTAVANTMWANAGSDLYYAGGNVGAGIAAPTARIHAHHATAAAGDYLLKVTSAATAGSEMLVVKGNGRVGIGVAAPEAPLHVASLGLGRAYMTLDNRSGEVNSSAAFGFAKGGVVNWYIMTDVAQTGANTLSFYDTSGGHRLFISEAGRVGIGTTQPEALFSVPGISSMSNTGADAPLVVYQNGAGPSAVFMGGNLGVGTTNPGQKLTVAGLIESTVGGVKFPDGSIQTVASGASLWTSQGTNIFANSNAGYAGIGTTDPQSALHVSTSGAASQRVALFANAEPAAVANQSRIGLGLMGSGAALAEFAAIGAKATDVGSNAGDLLFQTASGGTLAERMRLLSSGALGIGVTDPGEKLDLNGAMVFRAMAAPALASAGQGKMYFDTDTNKIKFSENGGAFINLIGGAGGAVTLQATTPGISDSGNLNLTGSGIFGGSVGIGIGNPTQKLDIRSGGLAISSAAAAGTSLYVSAANGKVGVGTSAPSDELTVAGADAGDIAMKLQNTTAGASSKSVFKLGNDQGEAGFLGAFSSAYADNALYTNRTVLASTSSAALLLATERAEPLVFASNSLERMRLDSSGLLGIGTTQPVGRLHVEGAGDILLNAAGNVGIGTTSPATRLHVAGSASLVGDVGVGTTSPMSKLHVVDGDIRISTSAGSRGIYFQDGSFMATAPTGLSAWSSGGGIIRPATLTDRVLVGRSDLGAGMFSVSTNTAAVPALYVESGNGYIGVGTSVPTERFDLDGAIVFRATGTMAQAGASTAKLYFDSSANKLKLSENGGAFVNLIGGAGGAVTLQGSTPGVPDTGHLNVSGTGTFGILALGTNAPTQKIDVRSGGLAVSNTTAAGESLFASASNGRVGIGTTSPAEKLQVLGGDVYVGSPNVRETTGNPDLLVQGNLVIDGKFVGSQSNFDSLGVGGTPAGSELFKVGTATLAVLSTGRTGLGTASPSVLLHLKSAAAADNGLYIDRDAAGSHKGFLAFRKQGAARYTLGADYSDNDTNDFYLYDDVAGAPRLYVTGTQMGIGTSVPTPGSKLDITGAGTVLMRSASNLEFDTSDPSSVLIRSNSGAGNFQFSGANFSVLGSGKVGIGTASPTKSLEVTSTGGALFKVDTSNADYVSLWIGGSEVARMKP